MIKRVTWFAGGVVVGIAGAGMAKRKVKEVGAQASPAQRGAQRAFGRRRRGRAARGAGRRAAARPSCAPATTASSRWRWPTSWTRTPRC